MNIDAIRRKATFLKSELRDVRVYERYRKLSTDNWDVTLEDDTVPQKPPGAIVLTREEARNHQKYMTAYAKAVRENRPLWVESAEEV